MAQVYPESDQIVRVIFDSVADEEDSKSGRAVMVWDDLIRESRITNKKKKKKKKNKTKPTSNTPFDSSKSTTRSTTQSTVNKNNHHNNKVKEEIRRLRAERSNIVSRGSQMHRDVRWLRLVLRQHIDNQSELYRYLRNKDLVNHEIKVMDLQSAFRRVGLKPTIAQLRSLMVSFETLGYNVVTSDNPSEKGTELLEQCNATRTVPWSVLQRSIVADDEEAERERLEKERIKKENKRKRAEEKKKAAIARRKQLEEERKKREEELRLEQEKHRKERERIEEEARLEAEREKKRKEEERAQRRAERESRI